VLGGVAAATRPGGAGHGVNSVGSLASRAAAFAALEALSLLVGFVAQTVLMRTLGLAAYGEYALAAAIGIVAVTVTDFGFNLGAVTRAIELVNRPLEARQHFWAVQLVKAAAAAAMLTGTLLWAGLAGAAHAASVLTAVAVGAAASWTFPYWFLLSRHRLLTISCSLLAARLLGLTAVLVWVEGPTQIGLALVLTLGAPVLAAPWLLLDRGLRQQLPPCAIGLSDLRDAARSGAMTLWLSGQGVASAAVVQGLLFTLAGSAALGLFAAADRVRSGVQGLFIAFGTAVFPRFVEHQVQRDLVGAATVGPLLRLQLAAATVTALLLVLVAPAIVPLVFGPGFAEARPVLQVLALALVTTTLLGALGSQVMLPRGQASGYSLATAAVLVLQCLALPVLAPAQGAPGAAWAVVLSEGLVAVLLLAWLARHRRRTQGA
jgi:O-antigen/teichoic acid export membrane protein